MNPPFPPRTTVGAELGGFATQVSEITRLMRRPKYRFSNDPPPRPNFAGGTPSGYATGVVSGTKLGSIIVSRDYDLNRELQEFEDFRRKMLRRIYQGNREAVGFTKPVSRLMREIDRDFGATLLNRISDEMSKDRDGRGYHGIFYSEDNSVGISIYHNDSDRNKMFFIVPLRHYGEVERWGRLSTGLTEMGFDKPQEMLEELIAMYPNFDIKKAIPLKQAKLLVA